MFQSPNRVKPLSNLLSALRPMDGPQLFQSPNRVKPLSNVFRHERCQYLFSVSIAQSRQTSFQPVCHPRSAPGEQGFNRPIASNLFPTCARRAVYALILYRFNRPIASNLFPTADLVRRVLEPLEGTFCERVALKSIITHGVENRQPLNE